MRQVRCGWKRVHPDGQAQPIEEISQRIHHFQFPHWQERCRTENNAEQGIDKEGSHTNEKLRGKIVGVLVNHITGRIAKAEEANVIYVKVKQLAEK